MILPDMNFMWWQASLRSNYSSSTKSLSNSRVCYGKYYEWNMETKMFIVKSTFGLIASNEKYRNTGKRYNHNITIYIYLKLMISLDRKYWKEI